jgi:Fe-Mn family superoxide dismutase
MFVLPELKHPYTAYEPYVDETTMMIHHQMHHGGYVKKLNQLLVDQNLNISRIEDIFEDISQYSLAIRNMAGGHYNHTVFWTILDNTMSTPSAELHTAITKTYGSLDDFKAEFTKSALSVFGSGWTWLVVNKEGSIDIVTTSQQDNPLMSDINKGYPIFGVDVWEHAYYLRYQNRRAEYINSLWSLINWHVLSERFSARPEMNNLAPN